MVCQMQRTYCSTGQSQRVLPSWNLLLCKYNYTHGHSRQSFRKSNRTVFFRTEKARWKINKRMNPAPHHSSLPVTLTNSPLQIYFNSKVFFALFLRLLSLNTQYSIGFVLVMITLIGPERKIREYSPLQCISFIIHGKHTDLRNLNS